MALHSRWKKSRNARHMFQILARLLGVSGIPINQKEATCNFTPSLIGNCDLVFNVFRGDFNWMSPCDLIIEIQAYKIPSEVKQFYKWILEGLIHICWHKAYFVLKLWKIANLIWKVGIYIIGEDLILMLFAPVNVTFYWRLLYTGRYASFPLECVFITLLR